MNEKIELIKSLLKQRRTLEINKHLLELDKDLERLNELEEFAKEVKRRVRSAGRSMSIGTSDFEDIFVKYKIKL